MTNEADALTPTTEAIPSQTTPNLTPAPRAESCPRCLNAREIDHPRLGRIRCPHCTTRILPKDPSGIAALTAAEGRRWNMIVQRAVGAEIMRAALPPGIARHIDTLPHPLLAVDRLQQRWAVGHGSGLPWTEDDIVRITEVEAHDDTFAHRQSSPPQLDDATQTVIDRIVGSEPDRRVNGQSVKGRPRDAVPPAVARFVWQWYCTPMTCVTMAQQRGMSESGLLFEWHTVLEHLRTRYLASSHDDLIALVRAVA